MSDLRRSKRVTGQDSGVQWSKDSEVHDPVVDAESDPVPVHRSEPSAPEHKPQTADDVSFFSAFGTLLLAILTSVVRTVWKTRQLTTLTAGPCCR